MAQRQDLDAMFQAALALDTGASRDGYLDTACAGDAPLRQRMVKMIAAHDAAGSFLERPAVTWGANSPTSDSISESPGTVIGPYKLLQQIGEGGMGVVFMAEQTHPIKRVVALKIIKPGMDTRQVIARFEAERQALAMMDHPNVAKVLDAGATDTGRPYFVMELVKGIPITQYCDEKRLPLRARLELLLPVCQAVQHAHQKGLIHRDIKPTNVLIAEYDLQAVPKVIDFGVAKATAQRLTELTMFTEFGQVVGTVEYMSPEQAKLNQLDIDTRSDIYSLGVLLYELLTGSTPFERGRLRSAAFDEMLRIIREEEPPAPSTRLSTAEGLPSIAANRGVDAPKLNGLVRGELDWIVMKALEKDRNRRYETANGLGLDLQRYLSGEPVLAAPVSAQYRVRKFAKKNRTVLTSAAAVLVCLSGVAAVSTWQAVRAVRAERLAVKEKEAAERSAAETTATLDFVEKRIFSAARPAGLEGGLGHEVTLRRAIEESLPWVEKSFKDKPLIEARLRRTLGVSFEVLGEPQRAFEQYQRAVELSVGALGPDHLQTIKVKGNLANTHQYLGRQRDALKLREEIRDSLAAKVGPEDENVLANMNNIANSYEILGKSAEGLGLREELLALRRKINGPDHANTLMAMNNLAASYDVRGRESEAFKLRETVLARCRATMGEKHPTTLEAMIAMATSFDKIARYDDALRLRELALKGQREVLGEEHPDTLATTATVARSYGMVTRYPEAVELGKLVTARLRAKVGTTTTETVDAIGDLAHAYAQVGDQKNALPLFEEVVALETRNSGPDHERTFMALGNLAVCYDYARRDAEALELREKVVAHYRSKPNLENRISLVALQNLGVSYRAVGRYEEAAKAMEQVVARLGALYGENDGDRLIAMARLAQCLGDLNREGESLAMSEDALRRQRMVMGNNNYNTMVTMYNVAVNYAKARRIDEALALYEELLPLHVGAYGPDHAQSLNIMGNLASLYNASGRRDEGIKLLTNVAERSLSIKGARDPETLKIQENLGEALVRADRFDEALKVYERLIPLQREILGDKNMQTLNAMLNRGNTLFGLGRHYEGLKAWEEAYPLQKEALGEDHAMTLATVHNIADAYGGNGEFEKSIPLRQDMLPREIKTLGLKHEYTQKTLFFLAVDYGEVGEYQKSAEMWKRAIAIYREHRGPTDEMTLVAMKKLADIHVALGQNAEAERLTKEVESLRAGVPMKVSAELNVDTTPTTGPTTRP